MKLSHSCSGCCLHCHLFFFIHALCIYRSNKAKHPHLTLPKMKMRNKIYIILDGRVALQNILFVLKKCEIYLRHAPIFIFYGNHKPENLYFSCIYILLCCKFYDSMVEWSIKVFLQNIKHCQHASSRFDNCIHAIKLFMTKATTVEPHINHF